MQYREVPWSVDHVHYPELVQDLMDLGLMSGGCMILDGDTDVTPIPLLVDREATMAVEVSDHHRTPAMRVRTVLRNGFLVETRLRWEALPPWPERMQKARRLTDIETEMTGHAAPGRSVVIETGPPERVLARHRDHVLAVSREQVSSPVELTTVDDALNIWNAALAHDERVEQTWREMVDRGQLAAFVVAVLLVIAGWASGEWWVVAITPLLVAATWYASPYVLVLLRTSRQSRPAFAWTNPAPRRPLESAL
jgi:hypothetical protein